MSTNADEQKLPLRTLTAMVVGGMVGAGVFSIPRNFAQATGVYGALIAWAIAGAGMLMLGFVFQTLANRKPDLDAGVYAYARAGFGPYVGFFSAFGYWASACVGNVSYWILIKSTLGAFFPVLGQGNTLTAVLISSVGIWAFHFLVLRGVKEAAAINTIVTIAKIIPLLLFVVLAIFYLKPDVFAANLWGGAAGDYGNLFEQVKATMLVTVFVFLGIEGASNYSRFAEKREDVGIATVTGFLGVLALFASVSILSYGILPRAETRAAAPALGRWRARGRRRPLGCGVHRRRRDRLGARCLPGLDADGRRGAVGCGEEAGHAGLPGARERQPGAVVGAADDHAADSSGARRHAVLRRRLHLRAVAVQPPVADSLLPLGGLCADAGVSQGDLREGSRATSARTRSSRFWRRSTRSSCCLPAG